jgi:hypothetical protein
MTSAILTKLAETYPEVLTTPESILGPNALKVLEFWRFLDSLSEPEKEEIGQRYFALDEEVRDCAFFAAMDAAGEVVGENFKNSAWIEACDVTGRVVFGDATMELIGNVDNKVTYDLIMSYKQP